MAKNWIKSATVGSHGQFAAKAQATGKTTEAFAREHANSPGRLGKQANLALTLIGASHDSAGAAPKSRASKEQSRYGKN